MVTCNEVHNCVDYFMCCDCPAKRWMWDRIGRGQEKRRSNMNRKDTLMTAESYVNGQREADYGTPEDNFKTIGEFWDVYANTACVKDGKVHFSPHDVAMMMSLMKHARIATGTAKDDNYIDACGYLACAAEISDRPKEQE